MIWGPKNYDYEVTLDEWQNRVTWDSLTSDLQQRCCKGSCGIEMFGFIKYTPDFTFKTACCRHDFGYLRGGSEKVRNLVDANFKEEIRKLARDTIDGVPMTGDTWWFKRFAELYAGAVKSYGWIAFEYGPMKTMDQIVAEINMEDPWFHS